MEKKEYSQEQLLCKVEMYCARAERCAFDVRQKLHMLGASSVDIDNIVEKLTEDGYIDEGRYCVAFVHDAVAYQMWGRQKIRMALWAKRLPDSAIEQALANIDTEEYQRALKTAIRRKRGASKDTVSREQVFRYLLSRGFESDEIVEALTE